MSIGTGCGTTLGRTVKGTMSVHSAPFPPTSARWRTPVRTRWVLRRPGTQAAGGHPHESRRVKGTPCFLRPPAPLWPLCVLIGSAAHPRVQLGLPACGSGGSSLVVTQLPSVGHLGLDMGSLDVGSSLALTLLYQLAFSKLLGCVSFCIFICKIVMPAALPYLSLCGCHV